MSTDSTPTWPERPEPSAPQLPQFDPTATDPRDETQVLPVAPTAQIPIAAPPTPYTYAGGPAPVDDVPRVAGATPESAPEREMPAGGRGPRWSAKKTALTAGLALVLTSAGAIAAAAAMPSGSTADTGRMGGPGQGRAIPFPGGQGQQGQQGQQGPQVLPNPQDGSQLPGLPDTRSGSDSDSESGADSGGGLTGLDPQQLLQMSPDELLRLLDEQGQLGSGGSGQTDPFGQDGPSEDGTGTQDGATRTT
jgi:hypothetical protein